MHVKLIVEPTSMYMSGPPRIVVMGSSEQRENKSFIKYSRIIGKNVFCFKIHMTISWN